jgi:eukaryotic-like serine/threonine-protein kinase
VGETGLESTYPASPAGPYDDEELPQGTAIGRFVVLKRLGRGGMGVVYLGWDNELERRLAIKVMRAEASEDNSSGEARARLLREAQAMAKLAHPNVVSVFEVGTWREEVFIALEYVDGATLREWQAKRPEREIVAAYTQAGRGLEAAHAERILHRDFKPENVLVDASGRVRVLDFGLARLEGEREPAPARGSMDVRLDDAGVVRGGGLSTPLTNAGAILGTPAYMAPEQLAGQAPTARTDQFAFSVALWEALFGGLPFEGTTIPERLANMRAGRFAPAVREARVPAGVRRALLRGLAADPDARFASMGELLAALERAVARPRRTAAWIAIGAVCTAAAAIPLVRLARPQPCGGGEEAIAPAWSNARAREVRQAFETAGHAEARQVFGRVRPLLDGYARSWIAMRRETCEATRVRGEQSEEALDLRMECLQQRARELQATVDLLARADATLVDRAGRATSDLTPVASCVDVAALRAPFAPPRDDAQRRAVEDVRRGLAEVEALYHAGRWREGYDLAQALVERANVAGYPPTRAEAMWQRGRFAAMLAMPEAAAWIFDAAIEAEAAKDDAVAARAWTQLAHDSNEADKHDQAEAWARIADATLRRMPPDDGLRAQLCHIRARMAYDRGSRTESLALAREALALDERALGDNATPTMEARADVIDALADQGDLQSSLDMSRALYAAQAATLGERHSATLWTLVTIGDAETDLGETAAGLRTLERAWVARESMDPRGVAWAGFARAKAIARAGRTADAVAAFEESPAPPDASTRGNEEGQLAAALAVHDDVRDADTYSARAVARLAEVEHKPQDATEALCARAIVEARRGEGARALADADAAVASIGEAPSKRDEVLPYLARGEALLAQGRGIEARASLDRAHAAAEAAPGDAAVREAIGRALARAKSERGR